MASGVLAIFAELGNHFPPGGHFESLIITVDNTPMLG